MAGAFSMAIHDVSRFAVSAEASLIARCRNHRFTSGRHPADDLDQGVHHAVRALGVRK